MSDDLPKNFGPLRLLPQGEDFAAQCAGFRWDIPEDFNLGTVCLTRWAQLTPDATAVIDRSGTDRKTYSFAQLQNAAARLASVLRGMGVGRGDRVGILLPQSAEVIIAHAAIWQLEAVSLPLFTLFGPDALSYRLQDSGARVIIAEAADKPKLADAAPDLPSLLVGDDFWAAIDGAEPMTEPSPAGAEDPAVMIYTSGTTGAPKGVLHAHRFLLGHLPAIEMHHPDFGPGDIGWTPADWAWIGGLMDLALPTLFYGCPLVALRLRKFDPQLAVEVLKTEGVTRSFLPPAALRMMQAAPRPEGVTVTSVSSGGEPMTADMIAWTKEVLGASLSEIYGQTECNLVVSSAPLGGVQRPGWMGVTVPGVTLALLDAQGVPVPDGTEGEICVERDTATMFLRYWNRPAQTEAKFQGNWMRTGDVGVRDRDGYIRFVARNDDVINVAGYRVGPGEIEACLASHPAVEMAAVIGVDDARKGQAVAGFVTLRPGSEADPAALQAHVKARLSPHLAPREVHVLDEMPMTATGKIMRRALRNAVGDPD